MSRLLPGPMMAPIQATPDEFQRLKLSPAEWATLATSATVAGGGIVAIIRRMMRPLRRIALLERSQEAMWKEFADERERRQTETAEITATLKRIEDSIRTLSEQVGEVRGAQWGALDRRKR